MRFDAWSGNVGILGTDMAALSPVSLPYVVNSAWETLSTSDYPRGYETYWRSWYGFDVRNRHVSRTVYLSVWSHGVRGLLDLERDALE